MEKRKLLILVVIIIPKMIRLCTRMLRASIKVARIDMTPKSVKNLSKIDFVRQHLFSILLWVFSNKN
jgi:hypothetical protein